MQLPSTVDNFRPRSTTSDGKFWTPTQTGTRNHSILGMLQGKYLLRYLLIHSQGTYEDSLKVFIFEFRAVATRIYISVCRQVTAKLFYIVFLDLLS